MTTSHVTGNVCIYLCIYLAACSVCRLNVPENTPIQSIMVSMAVAMDVDAVLADQQSRYKTVEVRKEVELQLDLGNLLASDLNDIDTDALK